MSGLTGPSLLPSATNWDDLTIAGFDACTSGEFSTAAIYWDAAHKLAGNFANEDPRKAASANNSGVGRLLTKRGGGIYLLRKANRTWREFTRTCASPAFSPELSGRGSVFHIKLASRYAKAFAQHHQAYALKLCSAASAICTFNCVVAATRAPPAHCRRLYQQVETAFGANCRETSQLARIVNNDVTGEKSTRALYQRWPSLSSSRSGSAHNILAAAHLTALIDLSWLKQTS